MKKVYHNWEIPHLKWYEKLYMRITRTERTEDAKHIIYRKKLGKKEFVDRLRKGR